MASFDVCVLGSLNMDLVVRAARLPQPGETLLGGPFERHPGGKGANQAVAAARAGASVAMIGAVGSDEHGRQLVDLLAAEGVDVAHVARHACASGVALITVAKDGENTIVVAPGANAELSRTEVERASELIASSRVLLAQLETPIESVARAFEIARARGVTTVLNAAPARELPAELLSSTDVLVVNENEAQLLSGRTQREIGFGTPDGGQRSFDPTNADDHCLFSFACAEDLLELGPPCVFVTIGRFGALVTRCEDGHWCPAFEVETVDSTGAGDAFAGALALALARGFEGEAALRFAQAAGALATTRRGAIPSMPARAEIERLLASARA